MSMLYEKDGLVSTLDPIPEPHSAIFGVGDHEGAWAGGIKMARDDDDDVDVDDDDDEDDFDDFEDDEDLEDADDFDDDEKELEDDEE